VLLGDLIEGVATDTGQPKAVVEAIMRGVLARIEGAVGKRETVNLDRFGRFKIYERSPRRGRNLRTGEKPEDPGPRGRCASSLASTFGMPLLERSASAPERAGSSCRSQRQVGARKPSETRRALVEVLALGEARRKMHSVAGEKSANTRPARDR
jgi:nucleoid DNA-binding protein